jgi:hypothetical protein
MAHEAAKRDMDTISWTPGQVQADRYDLSKQVDEIIARKQDDGTTHITATMPGGGKQDLGMFAEEKLEAVVGKDLAKSIRGQKEKNEVYSGEALKIGGEGMKNFYDKMIRKSADKLGKKYGVKAEVREIKTNKGGDVGKSQDMRWYHYDADGMMDTSRSWKTEAEAQAAMGNKVWSLPLTPELKKALLKGGVTFGVAAAAMDQDNETWGF